MRLKLITKKSPRGDFKLLLYFNYFGFGPYAAGAGFYAFAIGGTSPLQVWLQADNRATHRMTSFNSAGVNFTAHGTCFRHKSRMSNY